MKKTLYQSLAKQVKQMIYFYEIDHFYSQINSLLEEQKLTPSEYDYLLKITKKQLKQTLDLNLLPSYEYIAQNLTDKYPQGLIKIDAGEIVAAEFAIIEQEAMNLNLAKVKYIQDNFMHNQALLVPNNSPDKNTNKNPIKLFFKNINDLIKSFGK